jgi:hypothetical protein
MNTAVNYFDPARMEARDGDGLAFHPDLDQFMVGPGGGEWNEDDEGHISLDKLRAAGFEAAFVDFEDDSTEEQMTRYEDEGSGFVPWWEPTPPAGDGWQLVAVYSTEEAIAMAMFVRARQ